MVDEFHEDKKQMISAYEKMVKTLIRVMKVFRETESTEICLENGETLKKSEIYTFEEIFNKLVLFYGIDEITKGKETK